MKMHKEIGGFSVKLYVKFVSETCTEFLLLIVTVPPDKDVLLCLSKETNVAEPSLIVNLYVYAGLAPFPV